MLLAGGKVHYRCRRPSGSPMTIFSTSSSMEEATAELPMLALIFTHEIASDRSSARLSGWLMLAGMMARPAGDFLAHKFGSDHGADADGGRRSACPAMRWSREGQCGHVPSRRFLSALHGQAFSRMRDVFHLGRDDAAARVVHLADVGAGPGAARRALQAGGAGAQFGDALGHRGRRGWRRRRAPGAGGLRSARVSLRSAIQAERTSGRPRRTSISAAGSV